MATQAEINEAKTALAGIGIVVQKAFNDGMVMFHSAESDRVCTFQNLDDVFVNRWTSTTGVTDWPSSDFTNGIPDILFSIAVVASRVYRNRLAIGLKIV